MCMRVRVHVRVRVQASVAWSLLLVLEAQDDVVHPQRRSGLEVDLGNLTSTHAHTDTPAGGSTTVTGGVDAPAASASPAGPRSARTFPVREDRSKFCIFMASITHNSWPISTWSPTLTLTEIRVPGMGEMRTLEVSIFGLGIMCFASSCARGVRQIWGRRIAT